MTNEQVNDPHAVVTAACKTRPCSASACVFLTPNRLRMGKKHDHHSHKLISGDMTIIVLILTSSSSSSSSSSLSSPVVQITAVSWPNYTDVAPPAIEAVPRGQEGEAIGMQLSRANIRAMAPGSSNIFHFGVLLVELIMIIG